MDIDVFLVSLSAITGAAITFVWHKRPATKDESLLPPTSAILCLLFAGLIAIIRPFDY